MESLDATILSSMDDFLDFSSDLDDNDDLDNHNHHHRRLSLDPDNHFLSLPEFAEEELEWLSNKDAFPGIETSIDVFSNQIPMTGAGLLKSHSPVSVLDSITTSSSGSSFSGVVNVNPPRKARSKAHRRARSDLLIPGQQCWLSSENLKKSNKVKLVGVAIGRKCQHCGVEKTPQWRAGPLGSKTLCNACGVRYKSGRLVPEYRPANSPTFSLEFHSNSHRKVLEMRRQKQIMGLPVEKPMEKG